MRTRTYASAQGGPIMIEGRNVELTEGAFVAAETASGSTGAGGAVEIRATERFTAAGQDWNGFPVYLLSATEGAGPGGAILVQAPDIRVSGGFIDSVTQSSGNGGAVTLSGDTIRIEPSGGHIGSVGSLSGAFATGAAGPVTLRASRSITIDGTGFNFLSGAFGPTQVLSQNVGPGPGGNVLVESPSVVVDNGAWIVAQGYGTGDVGSVVIRPHDLTLRGRGAHRQLARQRSDRTERWRPDRRDRPAHARFTGSARYDERPRRRRQHRHVGRRARRRRRHHD